MIKIHNKKGDPNSDELNNSISDLLVTTFLITDNNFSNLQQISRVQKVTRLILNLCPFPLQSNNKKVISTFPKFSFSLVNFIPKKTPTNTIFYGGTHFYIFIRLLFVLYERFLIAKKLSQTFENTEKTSKFSAEQKETLSKQRYHLFKLSLVFILQNTKEI